MDDYVNIRKGTNTKYAMEKVCKKVCEFIQLNGKNLKQEHGITMNIQNKEYD